jgi:hypothetical protein
VTIKRSVDDLATPRGSSQKASGWVPDAAPRWAQLLALKWQADGEAERAAHVSSGAKFRASDAGGCARKLAYKAAGIAESNPMDITGYWNTTIGRWLHDQWQKAMDEDPDVHASFEVEFRFLDGRGIVRIDAVIELETPSPRDSNEPFTVAYEGKSINGYGYKAAIGKIRRGTPAEGPRMGAILQGAIGGLCANADEVVVGNWAKETLSGSTYGDVDELTRFTCEWTLTRDQFEPLARAEIERVGGILDLLETGLLASRKIPGVSGEIVDPAMGRWERRDPSGIVLDTGTTWECKYCAFQDLCAKTPSGRVAVDQVVELRGAM